MYSTQTSLACQGEEYRTREQARLAFVVSFGKDVVVSLRWVNDIIVETLAIIVGIGE